MSNTIGMRLIVDSVSAFRVIEALVKDSRDERDHQIWSAAMNARISLETRLLMFDDVEVTATPPTTTA